MRAFFAIDLSHPLHTAAEKIIEQQPFSDMRWTKPENLHLTLRFLASLEEETVAPLCENVATALADIKPFDIETHGTIYFPTERPRVFAIAVRLSEELAMLVKALNHATESLGFAIEQRPFLPHITLGRFKHKPSAPQINYLGEAFTQTVSELVLYRSDPQPSGSVYSVLHRFNFA